MWGNEMREPKNLFEEIVSAPEIVSDLSVWELNKAKRQGIDWLDEIDRLLNDAVDTMDRNHERLGLVDGQGLPLSPFYGKEIKQYSDWHKQAKEQAEQTLAAINSALTKPMDGTKYMKSDKRNKGYDEMKIEAQRYLDKNSEAFKKEVEK
jgi:hypothetical protein